MSMKIVASITNPKQSVAAQEMGAGLIELRLDLVNGDVVQAVKECKKQTVLPLIATLRSAHEGGRYPGSVEEWFTVIRPVIPLVDYIDVERRFSAHAEAIRAHDVTIIASSHVPDMPTLFELFGLERELRSYGDIPKIVVTPRNEEDIIDLFSFTHAAAKPVITGVTGTHFRSARLILGFLFGSEFVYCHAGTPTAEGQFSVAEAKAAMDLFGAGRQD
jgi:3-dehydroquinate dehydratase-1